MNRSEIQDKLELILRRNTYFTKSIKRVTLPEFSNSKIIHRGSWGVRFTDFARDNFSDLYNNGLFEYYSSKGFITKSLQMEVVFTKGGTNICHKTTKYINARIFVPFSGYMVLKMDSEILKEYLTPDCIELSTFVEGNLTKSCK